MSVSEYNVTKLRALCAWKLPGDQDRCGRYETHLATMSPHMAFGDLEKDIISIGGGSAATNISGWSTARDAMFHFMGHKGGANQVEIDNELQQWSSTHPVTNPEESPYNDWWADKDKINNTTYFTDRKELVLIFSEEDPVSNRIAEIDAYIEAYSMNIKLFITEQSEIFSKVRDNTIKWGQELYGRFKPSNVARVPEHVSKTYHRIAKQEEYRLKLIKLYDKDLYRKIATWSAVHPPGSRLREALFDYFMVRKDSANLLIIDRHLATHSEVELASYFSTEDPVYGKVYQQRKANNTHQNCLFPPWRNGDYPRENPNKPPEQYDWSKDDPECQPPVIMGVDYDIPKVAHPKPYDIPRDLINMYEEESLARLQSSRPSEPQQPAAPQDRYKELVDESNKQSAADLPIETLTDDDMIINDSIVKSKWASLLEDIKGKSASLEKMLLETTNDDQPPLPEEIKMANKEIEGWLSFAPNDSNANIMQFKAGDGTSHDLCNACSSTVVKSRNAIWSSVLQYKTATSSDPTKNYHILEECVFYYYLFLVIQKKKKISFSPICYNKKKQ